MSLLQSGEKHFQYGLRGENSHNFGKTQPRDTRGKMSKAQGTTIYLGSLDKKLLVVFNSARVAAEFLDSSPATIMRYVRYESIFKKKYYLSLKKF